MFKCSRCFQSSPSPLRSDTRTPEEAPALLFREEQHMERRKRGGQPWPGFTSLLGCFIDTESSASHAVSGNEG